MRRLEAFGDGVIAIIITIMVLEMKAPHRDTWASLQPLFAVFISSYSALDFINVAIFWNHYYILHACETVNTSVKGANIHLLFWLIIF
ncbi:MAG: DUF1211 domain-containing protein [Pedobacter sp.]|nr:DUF1211 domain-containing protein [Chitinophagaceae bacterium]